ncbi:MAG: pyridoxal-phosphate dependent enzyme [Planctomycetes bacterium]|nr:pyridoxal-phosphate dependent enzyme [Planctomycetota bacterium]
MKYQDVLEAARRIDGHIARTPLAEVPRNFVPRRDVRLFLKLECLQRSGSFKARGAANFLARLRERGSVAGVVTFSSGNHGRAVAEAARAAGVRAIVVAPETIDLSKAEAIRAAGAELLHAGRTTDDRRRAALAIAAERGFEVIPPFDHEWIIAGQGTAALEALEQIGGAAGLWAPVGGGGLAAGSAVAGAGQDPKVPVFAVEPAGAACYRAACDAGAPRAIADPHSVADGLLPLSIGALNWEILHGARAASVIVSEAAIVATLRVLREVGIAAEPSGAVAAAPLLFPERGGPAGGVPSGTHVAIVSGGNIAPARLRAILQGQGA